MRGCARCRQPSWRDTRPRRTTRTAAGMSHEIADQVPADSAGAREIGFAVPRTLQRQPHAVRQSRQGPQRQARADRPGGTRRPMPSSAPKPAAGATAFLARAAARRPRPDVPRRHAGLSGRVLRRGARRLRAAADQHADAAGPAAILSRGFRRDRRGGGCRVLRALRCRGLQGHAAAHADRRQWRRRRSRRAEGDGRRGLAFAISGRAGGSRHASQRDGVLDVFVRLDRPAQGHRPSAARHGL